MKKIAAVLIVIVILFSFSACGGPNAELTEENITETVDVVFAALQEFDSKALDTYVDSTTLSYILRFADGHQQFADLGKAIFKNLSYEIKQIDIENKTVTLTVKNKDLYSVAENFTEKLLSRYSTFQLLSKLANDSWLDNNLSTLVDSINDAEMSDNSNDIILSIEQEDDHLVLTFDTDAEDAVSGGALNAINNLVS